MKREYVQVLRLLEAFDLDELHGAVRDALRMGAEARHFGVYAGLIDEHDIADLARVRQQPSLAFAPNRPRRLDIAAFLLTGVCGFF